LNTYDAGVRKIPKFTVKAANSNVLDKWVVARLHQTIDLATKDLNRYGVSGAAREIESFAGDLSRWYIRRSRRRFQKPESQKDYEAALGTLNYVLLETSKLIAPFTPFFAEALYRSLGAGESVHLEDWPKTNKKLIDKKLLGEMETVRLVASLALAKRAELGIKVRQPLQELKVRSHELRNKKLLEVLRDEVNVRKITFDSKVKDEIELDTEITHELKEEGWFRELVRLTQGLRQDAGLEPKDAIIFVTELPKELRFVLQKNEKLFKKEVNAKAIEYRRSDKFEAELETKLGQWPVWVALRRV
jgi:isoleucyl-tRNA synthetase